MAQLAAVCHDGELISRAIGNLALGEKLWHAELGLGGVKARGQALRVRLRIVETEMT